METRVRYPVEMKLKVIKMGLAGILVKEVMATLHIRNCTQLKTWMRWHRNIGKPIAWNNPLGKDTPLKRCLILKIRHQIHKLKIDI